MGNRGEEHAAPEAKQRQKDAPPMATECSQNHEENAKNCGKRGGKSERKTRLK